MSPLGRVLNKLMLFTSITAAGGDRGMGAKPPAAGRFFNFFRKKAILAPFGTNSVPFWSHSKELNCQHLKAS